MASPPVRERGADLRDDGRVGCARHPSRHLIFAVIAHLANRNEGARVFPIGGKPEGSRTAGCRRAHGWDVYHERTALEGPERLRSA